MKQVKCHLKIYEKGDQLWIANAIVKYIKQNNYKDISIVSISRPNERPSDEDELCARYIKSLL